MKDKSDSDILKIIDIFEEKNPNPKTELNYVNNLTLIIAISLSAQTTDRMVNKATENLFKNYNTIDDFLKLGEDGLINFINIIGLYRSKARNVIGLCKMIKEQYAGILPSKFEELIKLPGVGRKTANVYLSIVEDADVIAVDRHVHRVANRIGMCKTNTVEKTEEILLKKIPKEKLNKMHQWLVLHGRYICKARKPECNQCPINKFCKYYKSQKNKE